MTLHFEKINNRWRFSSLQSFGDSNMWDILKIHNNFSATLRFSYGYVYLLFADDADEAAFIMKYSDGVEI